MDFRYNQNTPNRISQLRFLYLPGSESLPAHVTWCRSHSLSSLSLSPVYSMLVLISTVCHNNKYIRIELGLLYLYLLFFVVNYCVCII